MDLISGLRDAAAKQAKALHPDLAEAFSLRGRTAVVTGAAVGIGRQTAITFAQAGADVVLVDLDEVALKQAAIEVQSAGVSATAAVVDVSSKEAVDELAAQTLAERGRIDVWANVAGIIRYSPVVDVSEADLRTVIEVNLLGTFWCAAAAARAMTAAGQGSIINVASAAADMPSPTCAGYGMTKAAVVNLTKTLAAEIGPAGVRVNAVAPGWIETPMTVKRFGDDSAAREATVRQRAALSPLRATGKPADIAYAMLYLASDASRFVTGQVVRPNGGIVML
jgi:3-oxoacyl-[acyl-carrier protein] reductase